MQSISILILNIFCVLLISCQKDSYSQLKDVLAPSPNTRTNKNQNPNATAPDELPAPSTIKNVINSFEPTILVKYPDCILCHGVIEGNFITDYSPLPTELLRTHEVINYLSNYAAMTALFLRSKIYVPKVTLSTTQQNTLKNHFKDLSANPSTLYINANPSAANSIPQPMSTLGPNDDLSFLTSNGNSNGNLQNYLEAMQSLVKLKMPDRSVNPNLPLGVRVLNDLPIDFKINTLYEYLNSIQQYRSDYYLATLHNLKTYSKYSLNGASAADLRAVVQEVQNFSIPTFDTFTFPTANDTTNAELATALIAKTDQSGKILYYTNSPTKAIECNGAVIVQQPVLLRDPRIQTQTGCRIYSNRSIFITYSQQPFSNDFISAYQTNPSTASIEGIIYETKDQSTNYNLQLYSTQGIIIGVGSCNQANSLADRIQEANLLHSNRINGLHQLISDDYNLFTQNGETILDVSSSFFLNASSPPRGFSLTPAQPLSGTVLCGTNAASPTRKVNLKRLALLAPVIHSRLTGNFSGIVIAEIFLGSLGEFSYKQDPIFSKNSSIEIYPEIQNDIINVIPAAVNPTPTTMNTP